MMSVVTETIFERVVDPYLHGVRIDSFLVREFRNYTPFRMARMVRAGLVTIDETTANETQRVRGGQQVTVRLAEPPDKLLQPQDLPLAVLYEDDALLVVNKPAGIVAHPVSDIYDGTLVNAVQHHLDQQTSVRGLLRPGIVHRLDRQTSGALVVAKNHLAHRRLSIAFQMGQIEKSYLALVEGEIAEEQGEITFSIGQRPEHGTILVTAGNDAVDPKPASTLFHVERRFNAHTLVRATPLTGRIHQIRVHLAAIGHPVVGDEFYDRDGQIKEWPLEKDGLMARHALHANRLSFSHPLTGQRCEFTAPLPDDIRSAVARLTGD